MDYNTNFNDGIKDRLIKSIYSKMPQYLSSKHRVHKLFFKKCDNDISKYETCIDNKKWKENIDQYISDSLRKKCYQEWVYVRRCAIRNLGDSFAIKLNMTRQLEDTQNEEEENILYYQNLYEHKLSVLKREKNQGGFPDEEEAAEEGEAEAEEESAEEGETEVEAEGNSESAITEDPALEQETPAIEDNSVQGEPAIVEGETVVISETIRELSENHENARNAAVLSEADNIESNVISNSETQRNLDDPVSFISNSNTSNDESAE